MKISIRLYRNGKAVQLPPITCRKVKQLSLENAYLTLFSTKIIERLYKKGWQFSWHIITGGNVKDLSPENGYPILFCTKIK